jgi:hypothetical protein
LSKLEEEEQSAGLAECKLIQKEVPLAAAALQELARQA